MLFLHKILNGVWMIKPDYAANYIPYITAALKGVTHGATLSHAASESAYIATPAHTESNDNQYIAVIPISGAITKHDQFCGPDGMVTIGNAIRSHFAADEAKGIILKIDSGGGEGMAMRHLAEVISERNKPVIAFIDDFACSAAYGIASACDYIVANSAFAEVGSIGTYMTVADYSKYWENEGIKLIDVYASASTDKNQEYLQAIKGNTDPLKKLADHFNEGFLSMIEKNRSGKLTAKRDTWGTGKVFFADEAIKLGLIDEINTFSNTLNSFV